MFEDFVAEDGFDIRDTVYGTVIRECKNGILIMLENGVKAFSKFSMVAPGSKLLCTVLKK